MKRSRAVLFHQVGITGDHHQQVADIVCGASCQGCALAQRLDILQALFKQDAIGVAPGQVVVVLLVEQAEGDQRRKLPGERECVWLKQIVPPSHQQPAELLASTIQRQGCDGTVALALNHWAKPAAVRVVACAALAGVSLAGR